MTEMKRKKLNSRWSRQFTRYSESRMIDDEQRGDQVSETTWLERRREAVGAGWRKGARVTGRG